MPPSGDQSWRRVWCDVLVYGDPSYTARLGVLLGALESQLAPGCASEDAARARLIHAGQIEQALQDQAEQGSHPQLARVATQVERVSDALAQAWLSPQRSELRHAAAAPLHRARSEAREISSIPLRVKIPEGFAFYALFPEQYAAAARQWLRQHEHSRGRVLVVGVRSIGTILSAVVRACLGAGGWDASRITVRPRGHPFAREVLIDTAVTAGFAHALVVDEGPGLSGSSMAATVVALERAGVRNVALLPGHAGEPGPAASPQTRQLWTRIPRIVPPQTDVRFGGHTLIEVLTTTSRPLLNAGDACDVQDLSAGRWRLYRRRDFGHAPVATQSLERPKLLVGSATRSVVWKFCGLAIGQDGCTGARSAVAKLTRLSRQGWTAPPLGRTLGFLALPWIAGRAPDSILPGAPSLLARYIRAAADQPLSLEDQLDSRERLRQLLSINTAEALGPAAADVAQRWCGRVFRKDPAVPVPGYGDGRMAPWEWVLPRDCADGQPLKLDAEGHSSDHTIIGRQPLAWDLAGALVEWGLTDDRARTLNREFARDQGGTVPAEELGLYAAAYASFRLGLCSQAASTARPRDAARLRSAAASYTTILKCTLHAAP